MRLAQPRRHPDALVGARRRHPDVGHHHIGALAVDGGQQRGQIAAGGDHAHLGLRGEDLPDALADDQAVIGQRDGNGHTQSRIPRREAARIGRMIQETETFVAGGGRVIWRRLGLQPVRRHHATALAVAHEHPSPALARSVDARSSVGARAPAVRPVRVRRPRPRGRLLRLGQGRPGAALHGLGVGHLAPRRPGHRRALPLGRALVAGGLHRRARPQRRAARRTAPAAAREPAGSAGRQHGRGRGGRPVAAAAHRPSRGDRPRRAGRWIVRRRRSRDGDQRDRGDGVDAGRRSHHRG